MFLTRGVVCVFFLHAWEIGFSKQKRILAHVTRTKRLVSTAVRHQQLRWILTLSCHTDRKYIQLLERQVDSVNVKWSTDISWFNLEALPPTSSRIYVISN